MLPMRKGGLHMYAAGLDLHEGFEVVRLSCYALLGDRRVARFADGHHPCRTEESPRVMQKHPKLQ
jgi:hypothetical protein